MDDPQCEKNNKNIFENQADRQSTVTSPPKKPAVSLVNDLKEIAYDADTISEFLTLVFGEHITAPETVLTWFVPKGKKPYLPSPSSAEFFTDVQTREPAGVYFATSTVTPDVVGQLYNRQERFSGLYLQVLDDVGTKVPISSIPEALEPTYIIESSLGNFQYGYVLAEPIRDIGQAKALAGLMAESGLTDGGCGAMPNKLVRLPGGINGKKDPIKGNFPVRLVHMSGDYWTPQGLLTAIDSDVKWSDVVAGCDVTSKRRGASRWSPNSAVSETSDGINDVVLEWLAEENLIYQDVGEWVMIKCPNSDLHSDDNPVAYYSPLGRGGKEFGAVRGFKCHHGHCLTYGSSDFLQYVANAPGKSPGPEMPVYDPCAALVRDYVFDAINDTVWRVTDTYRPAEYTPVAFNRLYPQSLTFIKQENGKPKVVKIKEAALWNVHPGRVSVHGTTVDPRTRDRIVKDIDGRLKINLFARSDFGTGEYDNEHVDKFKEFINYLIPKYKERKYFIDWLAAKYQDMSFRGCGILMIATAYGVGRGTLADMVHALLGQGNAMTKKFSDVVNPKDGFNDWQTSPMVIVNETKSTDSDAHYKASFETVKELIDTRPVYQQINTKHVKKSNDWVYTSWLLFSNHAGAIAGAENDRRVFVIANPANPAPPAYFKEIDRWANERETDNLHEPPIWAKHVGRWLSTIEPDMDVLLAPAPMTSRKRDMISATRSHIDKLVLTIIKDWPSRYIIREHTDLLVNHLSIRMGFTDNQMAKKIVWRNLQDRTSPMFSSDSNTVTLHGRRKKAIRMLSPERLTADELAAFEDEPTPKEERKVIRSQLEGIGEVMVELAREIYTAVEDMD